MFDLEKSLKAAGCNFAGSIHSLVRAHHPNDITSAPEAAIALRMLAAYTSQLAERVDFQASNKRAEIGAGLVALRNRRAGHYASMAALANDTPPAPAVSPAMIAELAGPVCCKCGADESAFFAETDSGAHVCETCYNMGDCEPIEGENPKVNISDLCAIPASMERDRTVPAQRKAETVTPGFKVEAMPGVQVSGPDQARKPRKGPQGGQGAKLSPPPAINPKGPQGAAVDLLAQARALSAR
jgi:hypothetical protein